MAFVLIVVLIVGCDCRGGVFFFYFVVSVILLCVLVYGVAVWLF